MRYVFAVGASASRSFLLSRQNPLTTSPTAKPDSAYWIAGASTVANVIRPNLVNSASQPLTAPGTVTERMPRCGIISNPSARRYAAVKTAADHPDAFKPYN